MRSHLKIVIVDGVYTIKGSTNWSLSGEQQQDNQLALNRNAVIAAETRAILDLNHDFMLKQMVTTNLDVGKLLARRKQCLRFHPCRKQRKDSRLSWRRVASADNTLRLSHDTAGTT
jgi:phosphatidylserine/phosphatidylglycerophosphate/cardiolipin synthase-like enzyme